MIKVAGTIAALILFIATTAAQTAQVTLISSGAAWKYLDNGTNQGTAWRNAAFDDAAWASGASQLGYGDGDEATVVGYGPNRTAKYITTYFRKNISISNPAQYSGYTLNVKRDDGVVVYVNGVERYRNNINATATITYTTLAASANDDGATWQTTTLPANIFTAGNNIIAVEIHQCYPDNADISFDLELKATLTEIIPDTAPPTVTNLSPADDSSGVSKSANLILTFNEPVVKGAGNILIRENGSTVQTIDVNTAAVTITGNAVTINPGDFTSGTTVNIEMAAGVLKDTANNNFSGITNSSAWNFSVPATIASTLIASGTAWKYLDNGSNQGTAWRNAVFDDAAWASGNSQLGYGDGDEATVVGYGPNRTAKYITTYFRKKINTTNPAVYTDFTLNVKRDDGIIVYINGVEKYRNNITAANVTYTTLAASAADDGATWLTATFPAGLLTAGENIIAVEIHQCYPDNADISFDLELKATENNVAPDTNPPLATTLSPADDAANVARNSNLVITFNENIQKGTGNILIKENGIITQTIDVNSAAVNILNNTVTMTPALFSYNAAVNIEIASGAFKDIANNNFAGIANTTAWNFTIQQAPDITAPVVNSYSPVPGTTNNAVNAALSLTFSENIQKGAGNILIKENGTITQTIDVNNAAVTVSNNMVTIAHSVFTNSAVVNIEMPAGVFKDLAGNNFAGITNAATWSFSVVPAADVTAPVITLLSPADNAVNVSRTGNLVITFSEAVQKGTGDIIIKEGGIIKQTINVSAATVTVAGNTVTIDPSNFSSSAAVNVEMPAGIFKDLANNNFAGITNATAWNFNAAIATQNTLVASGTAWKYLDNGIDQGTAWKETTFNDAAWASGNSQLGYGDGDEATTVGFGPNSASKYITTYFRKAVNIPDASLYSAYTLTVKRDDGVVVYVNGIEKFRSNLPAGTITAATLASAAAADDGDDWQTITLPTGLLTTGNNVIAAEMHQNAGSSSDLSFDFELKASDSTDITAPVVNVFSPADNGVNIAPATTLSLTFNEPVQKGAGSITIKENAVVKQTIDVASAAVTVSGNTVTIAPSSFTANAAVNIEMPTGILKDFANNNFTGITNSTTWNFSVTGGVTTTLTRGPYLQMGTPNSITVRWRSAAATDTKVSYGLSAGNLNLTASIANSVTDHEIQLTGLSPDTKYFYSIGSSSQTLQGDAENYFVTAPVTGTEKKTRIWVNGDCGNNSTNQRNVRDQFLSYMGANYTDVWLLLGDNAYETGTDSEYQTKFFDIYKDKLLKQTVLWPSPGNHDYANSSTRANDHNVPYFSMFTMPAAAQAGGVASGTEAFYSFNYGNIHFVSMDSYGRENNTYKLYDTLGPQVVWLKQDLAANTQKWTVLFWHHPPYTMGTHNSDTENELVQIRQNLLRILDRYKVDLVLCGHSHNYERSRLMKGYYGNEAAFNNSYNLNGSSGKYDGTAASCPYIKNSTLAGTGIVYVVAGSSGQLSSDVETTFPHNAMYYSNETTGGSMALEIEGDRLDAKWVCADGTIKDRFTMVKDASIKKTIGITQGSSTTLTASWIGSYSWTGGANTRSITVSPTVSTTYIVSDGISCLADTFTVTVAAARRPAVSREVASVLQHDLSVRIYPNPAAGNAVIEYKSPATDRLNLELYDAAGKKVKTLISHIKTNGTYTYILNTRNELLKAGIYSVRITNGRQQAIQKFVVIQ
ncbi:MAG: Ig-like domain-containing protein [Ferruginibacter sp.]